ncbi:Nucleoside diphosphate kinase 7, partial [Globisporangium splendens]
MQALRETIYSFKAKWFDTHAQLNRPYNIRYFVDTHHVEIFDIKTNKLFLKKSECPGVLSSKDFFLGAKVLLYGRHFELQEYLDPFTAEKLGKQQQKAVLVLKDDTVAHIGAVLSFLQHQQCNVSALKMLHVSRAQAERFLEFHRATSEFAAVVDQLSSRPAIAIEVVAENCIEKLKQVSGILSSRFNAKSNEIESSPSVLEAQRYREFFFESPQGVTATCQNCTCCVVLPHILKEGLAGEVIEAIQEGPGVEITAMEMFTLDRTTAAEFLEVYEGVVPHFNETVDQFTTGPCIAMELVGRNAESVVARFRENAGPWDVEMAKELRPHTIRARYGHDRVRNAVHCTDLADDGMLESEYFFDILSKRQQKVSK